MSTIFEKIREYGQKREQKELEVFLASLDEDELIDIIREKITNANFNETWKFILLGFRDTLNCHKKRIAMSLQVLKQIEEKDISVSNITTIVNQLCLELTKLKSEDLAKLCNFCLEWIQSQKTTKMGWKDLLPEMLNVLMEREIFTYDELEYSGPEYKTNFISTLCMSNWSPNIVISLTSMFIDMPLSKEEHLKIVNKLGTFIEKLTPQEIPAFVYQLLRLCKRQNSRVIFLRLQHYFGLRIYNNASITDESSPETNSTNLDIIESTNNQDTIDAESTVLYHIHTAASLGHECIKDYLNSMKSMIRAPEFVLHPFQLMVLFTISTISHYEETVFDIIRPSIVRAYNEEQRKNHSLWFREMVPSVVKPEEIFSQVIQFCLQDKETTLPALVSFAFVLLGIGSGLGRDPIAEKQWNLGNTILLKIIKRKRMIAFTILQTLCNHIVTRQSVSQYIECLYILGKKLPLLILENQGCIIELIDSLVQVQGQVANQLLDALIPLMKVSMTLRDHLIILLRKALYSRSTETRQMAVNGFLKMITQLKLSNLVSLSQNSSSSGSFMSGHSIYTQLSINKSTQTQGTSAFSNEALCLEVLSILKRCFMQQAEVRSQLYEGLYTAVCVNPELGIPVLDVIWFHFNNYYIMDEDQLPPLDFKKIAINKDANSVFQEPLGKLIYTIGLIVTKVSEHEDNKENNTVIKFTNIMDSLCERMKNCELVHFELDDGTDLLDIVPESQKKMYILKEAMSVYEALIGYKIYSWNNGSENQGGIINSLFQVHGRLTHFSKTLAKPKKGEKRKKGDENKTTQQSQANTTTAKKEAQKLLKNFKSPDTVLDFETIKKALCLLHETQVSWTSPNEANVVKSKREFHQHIMLAANHLVQSMKRRKDIDIDIRKLYYEYITEIARIIFSRIIRRLNEFIDFDCTTAILAMECFHTILIVINNQYKSNLTTFLHKVVNDEEEGLVPQLKVIVNIYEKLFELDEEETSEDPEIKKLSLIVINTLNTLATLIPNNSNTVSVQLSEWLKNFACNHTVPGKVCMPFINLLFEIYIKNKISLSLYEQISISVGDTIGVITQEDQASETFHIINEATVHNIILSLCNSVKLILEDIDSMIARLKCEYNIILYPGIDNIEKKKENLQSKERGVCCQTCFVVSILTNLSNLIIQSGNISDAIFKSLVHLFNTLSLMAKHFIMRSTRTNHAFEGARFERLVKLAGKQLAPAVYKFILHIEESQKPDTQPSQTKKKSIDSGILKNRVLKETRLIPKVIYEMEQFSKYIIQLSNKTKVDLAKYVGQGTVRDFRIKELRTILEQAGLHENDFDNTVQSEEAVENDSHERNDDDDDSTDATPPPSKRSKR